MSDPVTYTAVLPTSRTTVQRIGTLLQRHRLHLGTRRGRRVLGCFAHAILIVRYLLDATRMVNLARDNGIGLSTCYRYVQEALDVLADQAPDLQSALLAARVAGHTHVNLDGTLIATNRVSTPGPTARKNTTQVHGTKNVDLWWSGKHHRHGGNVQVVTAPDGWPIWVSPVRPGRDHDTTCARTHPGLLEALEEFTAAEVDGPKIKVLADLGYEGERDRLTLPHKNPDTKKNPDAKLTVDQRQFNLAHAHVRARAEQGNAWLKNYRALQKVTLCPWRIGAIIAAVLVLHHLEHDRTT